ncbi:MAG: class II fructose-bisphosphate aldolase [Oscillospiraceae bacterium]|jgi:fructose-bisphosphate aldolase class II|nr:class II fructose-bisphosphate aldolase [Oscillospiraceae bacterium]
MPLVNTKLMLSQAYRNGYAVGAFNVNNMETVQGVAQAAYETGSPVIFQVSPGALKYAGHEFLVSLIKTAVEKTKIIAALHLDHGTSFELCRNCIDYGFTSVMIDGSEFSFEENIEITKNVVDYALTKNVSVEAELGRLSGVEEHVNDSKDALYTNPEQAREFIGRTGIHSLAVAIGTSHGINKFCHTTKPELRFDILQKIADLCPGFPLVLHGSSSITTESIAQIGQYGTKLENAKGIPQKIFCKAIKSAICKINIDSDLRIAITSAIKKFMFNNPNAFDPRAYLLEARQAIKELVKQKIIDILHSGSIHKVI